MEKFVGLPVHPGMHRRHRYYKWIDGFLMISGFLGKKKADDIKDELLIASLLMGPCYSNIRWPIDTDISFTDATPSSGGAVKACVSKRLAQDMFRSVETKGAHVRLERPDSPLVPCVRCARPMDPVICELTRCKDGELRAPIISPLLAV